eukprot:TRINITY_DN2462_c0_g1_i2.p1 TRINITY_DN2462_c0_g1~~TRINITY_DN2462_c0_g1_i2.p1  ORF type:complete len:709 (+),score=144.83 TRINITY_DN2462_c0_g1_i2:90-2216(+)
MAGFGTDAGKGKGKGKGKSKRSNWHQQTSNGPKTHQLINSQIIRASESDDVDHLMAVVMSHLSNMNLVNLSTALHRIAKTVGKESSKRHHLALEQDLARLCRATYEALKGAEPSQVQPQTLSNVSWSLATLRMPQPELQEVLRYLCVGNIEYFKGYELATTLWAHAKLEGAQADKTVLYAAANCICKDPSSYDFRCLATVAWAFATAKTRHPRLFSLLAFSMMPNIQDANGQEIANAAWGFASLGYVDAPLFSVVAERGLEIITKLKAQEISNLLWAFASNSFFHEAFYANALARILQLDMSPQHFANVLWACARVRPHSEYTRRALLTMLPLCSEQLRHFKPQEVSSILLAASKVYGSSVEGATAQASVPVEVLQWFNACLGWCSGNLEHFSDQSLTNVVTAYAMIPVPGAEMLMKCVADAVERRMSSMPASSQVYLLKGFGALPQDNFLSLKSALTERILSQLHKLQHTELSALKQLLGWREHDATLATIRVGLKDLFHQDSMQQKHTLQTSQWPGNSAMEENSVLQSFPISTAALAGGQTQMGVAQRSSSRVSASRPSQPHPLRLQVIGEQDQLGTELESSVLPRPVGLQDQPSASASTTVPASTGTFESRAVSSSCSGTVRVGIPETSRSMVDRMVIKNSFYHIEDSDDEEDDDSSTLCGSSHRSRSVPSSFGTRDQWDHPRDKLPTPEMLQLLASFSWERSSS